MSRASKKREPAPPASEVARQLDRLHRRIEFNDGFELDIITPNTWLAEWQARWELEASFEGRGDFEVVEIRLDPDADVFEPARQLAEVVVGERGHRILLVHVRDDGVDRSQWQPFFRRLNEIRNAIVRDFRGNLIVLLAAGLVTEFAGEAPDVWSVGAVFVVGTRTSEELDTALLEHVSALLRLTVEAEHQLHDRARRVSERWVAALGRSSATQRARQIAELMLAHDRPALAAIDTAPEFSPFHIQCSRIAIHSVTNEIRTFALPPTFVAMGSTPPAVWFGEIERQRLADSSHLLEKCQESAGAVFRVAMLEGLKSSDPRLSALRRCFDLLLLSEPSGAWEVTRGDERQAPVIELGSSTRLDIEMRRRHSGTAKFGRWRFSLDGGAQPWLPGIDPDELGAAELYRPSDPAGHGKTGQR
jgi:hypothetical protein